ncbi:hypothetical protein BT69DRAFT_1260950 [Atractiella rhizophila]|nr:hypothetical protein BT69DRAFT_1260950 [Atractiella rhizophila]
MLEEWRAVLEREECRLHWDKLVERTTVLEILDPHTRIAKTDFRLGWPASPRDAITITRTYMSPLSSPNPALLSISTSIPPSPEGSSSDPGFLRPSPPYVRSNLYLMAWCIQLVEDEAGSVEGEGTQRGSRRVRVTVFWQWDLKGAMFSTHHKEIANLLSSLINYLRDHSTRIPITTRYGRLLSLSSSHFDSSSDTFTTNYSILEESDVLERLRSKATKGLEEVREDRRERKEGMRRGIEFSLASKEAWDVRVTVNGFKGGSRGEGQNEGKEKEKGEPGWIAVAERRGERGGANSNSRFVIRLIHSKLENAEEFQRVKVVIQRLGGAASSLVRVNGKECVVSDAPKDERDPSSMSSLSMVEGSTSGVEESVIWFGGEDEVEGDGKGKGKGKGRKGGVELEASFGNWLKENAAVDDGESSLATNKSLSESGGEGSSGIEVETSRKGSLAVRGKTIKARALGPRTLEQLQMQMKKEINDKIRRSYIYFTSLLQEPEAKWRRVSEGRGVTVSKLDSIDPTLTIFRAEAVFVGLNVWDVFSTVSSAGARVVWDKTVEDVKLLEEVTDLTSLWRIGMKASWPVAARDSVQLRTFYKSPTSIHVFSSSTDDLGLFPSIPPVPSGTIRTHTDLHGWSIEGLSPTTTQIILLDQSDPKGWSSKSWTPNYLINSIAGVGEFAIKSGGPPLVTRLLGASTEVEKYDHDKSFFKLEYKASKKPLSISSWEDVPVTADPNLSQVPVETIECEIRCDCVTWASSVDVVIDPPPARTSVLRRHRLSFSGGTWLTIEHSAQSVGNDRIFVLIRKGQANKEKGSVFINGSKAKVDTEDLAEDEVKNRSKQKRIKVNPMPLDQYPMIGPRHTPKGGTPVSETPPGSATKASMPLYNDETVRGLPAVPSSPKTSVPPPMISGNLFSRPPQPPPTYSLEGLSWLQQFYLEQSSDPTVAGIGWSEMSNKGGLLVRKKLIPHISDSLPVYHASKVIEGVTASDLADVLNNLDCRKEWDDRVETNAVLESFGYGCYTSCLTTKSSFPLKGRVFCTSTTSGQFLLPGSSNSSSTSTIFFVASVSVPIGPTFDQNKLNPAQLPPGQVLLEGWILEPIDPYTSNTYQIPSARCSHFSCVDYLGSVSSAISSMLNTNFGRLMNSLEKLTKRLGALPHVHTPPSAFQIEGPLAPESGQSGSWEITDVADLVGQSKLLLSHFNLTARSFRSYTLSTLQTTPSSTLKASAAQRASRLANKGSLRRDSSPSSRHPIPHELRRRPSSTTLDVHRRSRSLSNVSIGNPFDPEALETLYLQEVIVDLKLFPAGYDLNCAATFRTSSGGDEPAPLNGDEDLLPAFSKVPLQVSVTDVPVPAVFLEASGSGDAAKRVQHLVRIFVPLNEGEKEPRPSWYKKLKKGESLVLDLRITQNPLADGLNEESEVGTGKVKVRVTFNGERVEVGEGRGLLGRSEDEGWIERLPKLSRTSRHEEEGEVEVLPKKFGRPLCVSNKLLKPPSSQEPTPDASPNPTPQIQTATTFDAAAKAATGENEREAGSDTPVGPGKQKRSSIAALIPKERSGSNPLLSLPGSLLSLTRQPSPAPAPLPTSTSHQQGTGGYSLRFLITMCIICFLFGSFLRALLAPIDFIFIPPDSTDMTLEESLMDALDPNRRWRAARRITQLRIPFFSWDFVVAMALRR